jgi:hypothetical protein
MGSVTMVPVRLIGVGVVVVWVWWMIECEEMVDKEGKNVQTVPYYPNKFSPLLSRRK